MTTDRLDYEQERELGRLTAAANLHRMRGRWTDAEDVCRQALGIAPHDAKMHEMLGDILHEMGKLDEALEEYKESMGLAGAKPGIETKYAKLAIEIADRDRARALAEDMIANPAKYAKRERKPIYALIAALAVPGLGQLYNGEMVKAATIFGAFLLFPISYALFPKHPMGPDSMASLLSGLDPIVQWTAIIALISYAYGIIDATVRAEKSGKAAQEKDLSEPK